MVPTLIFAEICVLIISNCLRFVLLKEKNMLLTMEHECKAEFQIFPNPERIDKVEESMENLETVVRERNKAYFELETTESADRPGKMVLSQIGKSNWFNEFKKLAKFALIFTMCTFYDQWELKILHFRPIFLILVKKGLKR